MINNQIISKIESMAKRLIATDIHFNNFIPVSLINIYCYFKNISLGTLPKTLAPVSVTTDVSLTQTPNSPKFLNAIGW